MEQIRQLDIVLVPVYYAEQTEKKVRPVLVVSNDAFHAGSDDVVGFAITSSSHRREAGVEIDDSDFTEGTLDRRSFVRAGAPLRVHRSLIKLRYGAVKPKVLEDVQAQWRKITSRN